MPVHYIPKDYHTITPYLAVKDAKGLVEFITMVFGATERHVMSDASGDIMHGEYTIGNSIVMISQAHDPWPETPAAMYLYLEEVDAAYERALAAGAESVMPPADQFYGDRHGGVKDAWGNWWWIAKHIEDVPPEELQRRTEEWAKKQAS